MVVATHESAAAGRDVTNPQARRRRSMALRRRPLPSRAEDVMNGQVGGPRAAAREGAPMWYSAFGLRYLGDTSLRLMPLPRFGRGAPARSLQPVIGEGPREAGRGLLETPGNSSRGRVCARPSCSGRGRSSKEMRPGSAREADDSPGPPETQELTKKGNGRLSRTSSVASNRKRAGAPRAAARAGAPMSGGGPRRLAGGRVCAKPSCRGRGRFSEGMRRGSAREADDFPDLQEVSRRRAWTGG
jgi:hypothetical protein